MDDWQDFEIIDNTMEAALEWGEDLYGNNWYIITREQIQALLDGKQLATSDSEYAIFISLDEPE